MLGVTSASIAPANLAKSTSTEQQSGTTFVQQAVLALTQLGKYEKLSVLVFQLHLPWFVPIFRQS